MTALLSFAFGLSHRLQNTIFLLRWSTPSQLLDGRINTFYPGAVIHHQAHLCIFCKGTLGARFMATWSPSPQTSPLGSFPGSLLLHPDDKTDRLKVCRCCRDLNQPEIQCRRLLRDCGSSLTRGHRAAGAAVNDCQGAGADYGSSRDAVCQWSAWSRTGKTPDH